MTCGRSESKQTNKQTNKQTKQNQNKNKKQTNKQTKQTNTKTIAILRRKNDLISAHLTRETLNLRFTWVYFQSYNLAVAMFEVFVGTQDYRHSVPTGLVTPDLWTYLMGLQSRNPGTDSSMKSLPYSLRL